MSASAGRVLLIHKGDYSSETTYNPMDEVLYEGSTYVCKQTSTSNLPTNTTYWQLVAQKGSNGAGVPTGGTTGQVMTKKSSTDYDVEWSDVELDALSIEEAREYELIPGKNLAVFNPFVGTESSVSVSVSDASTGELTLNGSASGSAIICISDPIANPSGSEDGSLNLKAGTYVLSSPQYSALSASFYLAVVDKNGNKKASFQPQSATDDHVEFTLNSDTNGLFIAIYLSSGAYFSSQTLQVMICTLADWNKPHTYEPYYVPVKDSKLFISDQQVLGAWNLAKNTTGSTTKGTSPNEMAYTVGDDGIISVSGTNNSGSWYDYQINASIKLKAGQTYYISGCTGGSVTPSYTYAIQLWGKTSQDGVYQTNDEVSYTSPIDQEVILRIAIWNGTTLDNQIFKPMISIEPNQPYVPYAMTNRELTDGIQLNDGTTTYWKFGKLVMMRVGAWTTVSGFTIPDGFRPAFTQYNVGEQRDTNNVVSFKRVTLSNNGTVSLSDSNTQFIGTFVYGTS